MEELEEMNSKILTKPEEYKFLEKIFKEQTKKKFKPNLLYRATRDTDMGLSFHKKCDNIKDTLTLVKTKTGNIFGDILVKLGMEIIIKKIMKLFAFLLI